MLSVWLKPAWLSAEILDAEITIQGYQCFRRDRNRHGGGIVVYVRDCLSTTPIIDNADLELLILLSAEILDAEITIQGYQCFRRDRNRHGGGIVVYVRDCLSTTPIIDNADLELLILSLTVNNRKTTLGTFYRPPNSSSELMDALYTCLENLDITCFTNFILLGDFNIDFCNTSHHLFCKLSNLMHAFSPTQVVKDPTHYSQS